jgi:hypothetical protein
MGIYAYMLGRFYSLLVNEGQIAQLSSVDDLPRFAGVETCFRHLGDWQRAPTSMRTPVVCPSVGTKFVCVHGVALRLTMHAHAYARTRASH